MCVVGPRSRPLQSNSLQPASLPTGLNETIDQLIPHLSAAVDRAENEGEELVSHTFWQVLLLILIWAGVYVGAKLLLHRYTAVTGSTMIKGQ